MKTTAAMIVQVADSWRKVSAPPAEDLQYLAWGWGEAAQDAFIGVAPVDVDIDSVGFLACTPLLDLPPRAAAAYLGTYLLALLRSIEGQEKSGFFHDVVTRAHVLNALTQPMFWERVVPLVPPQGRLCLREVVRFLAMRRDMLSLNEEQVATMESHATASV